MRNRQEDKAMIKFLKKNKGIAAGLFILTIIVCLAV